MQQRIVRRVGSGTLPVVPDQPSKSPGWPCLYGPHHLSVSDETDVQLPWIGESPPIQWSRAVGTGYSAPVVVGERLILLHRVGDEEIVEAFDPKTGDSCWTYRYPTSYVCRYEYSSGPYSTPVIHDGCVYAVGAQAQLHCLQVEDGTLLWKRMFGEEYRVEESLFAVGASPLIESQRLIFNLGAREDAAGIVAVDPVTGETIWTATDHGPGYATPIPATIDGRRYVFVVTTEGLVCLNPLDGHVHWSVEMKPGKALSVNATSPVVIDDLVLMSTGPGKGTICLRVLETGYEEVWRDRRILDSQFNPLVIAEDRLFGFTASRQGGPTFRCIEPRTGELCWELASGIGRGTALVVDGQFVFLGEHGHLASAKVTTTDPPMLQTTEDPILTAPTYSAPALLDGRLYLRNESTLLSIDLRRP